MRIAESASPRSLPADSLHSRAPGRLRRLADAVWDVPIAFVSFAVFKTTRLLIRRLTRAHYARHPDEATRWRLLSRDTLSRPIALPIVMTSGPRWNTHAVVGSVGPLRVSTSLAIRHADADRSAPCWTVAVHTYPQHRIVSRFGSGDSRADPEWSRIALAPGAYSLVLRYYHCGDTIALPAVTIDGALAVDALSARGDVNAFYSDLGKRRSAFYRLMHRYVFTLVRFRAWLPEAFVTREVLPIGNPETAFRFDILWPGTRARVSVDPAARAACDVYYTVYGCDSFPLEWNEVFDVSATTALSAEKSLLLVRAHAKRGGGLPSCATDIRIDVE